MAAVKIPARDIIIQISDGATTPTWIGIGQLTSATYNPGENEEKADTTTFDSAGEYEGLVMQRGASLALEGFLRKDGTTAALDAGQAQVATVAALKGVGSLGKIRFRHPMDTSWKVWDAMVSLGEQGGGNNDMTGWKATFTKSGPATSVAVS